MQALRFRHLPVRDDDRLIGLLTERDLLRLSTSNLLPHRTEQDPRPRNFSPNTDQAVRVGSELSRRYLAPMTIIHIYDPVAHPLPEGYMMFTPRQLSRMWAEFEKRLALAATEASDGGAVQPETRLLEGITETEIVRFARDSGYDLIVMALTGGPASGASCSAR